MINSLLLVLQSSLEMIASVYTWLADDRRKGAVFAVFRGYIVARSR